MAQSQLIQGSWEKLAARAEEFEDRNDLMLIIPGDNYEAVDRKAKEGMSLLRR